jgi:hypothetical protein
MVDFIEESRDEGLFSDIPTVLDLGERISIYREQE